MNTIERILPTEQTETEFFNQKRIEAGLEPITSRVTKIREGLRVRCGPDCHIESIGAGQFIEHHMPGCRHVGGQEFENVGDGTGQACASLIDNDGTPITGVLVLSGLFPYEKEV